MDIYERLKKDHATQRELAAQLVETEGASDGRKRLWTAFKTELEAHAAAEEQTFYAELIAKPKATEQTRHSVSEHKEASDLVEELETLEMSSGGWLQKFKKLKEEVEHHLDEEENKVFKLARTVIDDACAERLAEDFNKRKPAELKDQKKAG